MLGGDIVLEGSMVFLVGARKVSSIIRQGRSSLDVPVDKVGPIIVVRRSLEV